MNREETELELNIRFQEEQLKLQALNIVSEFYKNAGASAWQVTNLIADAKLVHDWIKNI